MATSTIPVHCGYHKMIAPDELLPHPRNPNKHPDKQIRLLAKVIERQGWRSPVVVSKRSGFIVSGHGRRLAGLLLRVACPTEYQDFSSEEEELAHLLADNQIAELAEMDTIVMGDLLNELDKIDFDLEFAGFPQRQKKQQPGDANPIITPPGGTTLAASDEVYNSDFEDETEEGERVAAVSFTEVKPDTSSSVTLKEDVAFDSALPFNIPQLRPDMLGDIPSPIAPWIGERRSEKCENYLWCYGGDSMKGLPLDHTVMGFYTDDDRFELVWSSPVDFTIRLLKLKLRGIISPNFSLYDHMPRAWWVWNSYRAKWVSRYWQEAGIRVVPDVYTSEQGKYNWIGIPKKAPCLALQQQTGEPTIEYLDKEKHDLAEMVKALDPQSIFLYTTPKRLEQITAALPKQLPIIHCETAIVKRSEAIKKERKRPEFTEPAEELAET